MNIDWSFIAIIALPLLFMFSIFLLIITTTPIIVETIKRVMKLTTNEERD
jgi:hypothetical protein